MAKRRTWKRDRRGRFASTGSSAARALAKVGIRTPRYKADQAAAKRSQERKDNRALNRLLRLEAKELGVDPKQYAAQQRRPKKKR